MCLFWQSFMIVLHRKLLLKVSSDDAAAPKAINVVAIWCWVWVSHFLLLDLITLLHVDFCFFVLVIYNQFKKASVVEPILKSFMKTWRSKSFIRMCIIMASCIIYIFKVVSVSSCDGILIFWHIPVLHIIHLCRDRQLW